MSQFPLLSIHYDGEIIRTEDDSVIFSSANPIFAYLSDNVRCLSSLRNLILDATGKQGVKRVKKIYYRYPVVVDNDYFYKRFSLRTDEEVDLAIYCNVHHPDIHLLELFAILVDMADSISSSHANDTQSTDPARGLIRGMMFDLNVTPEGSMNASNSALNLDQVGSMEKEVESHQRAAVAEHDERSTATEHPMAESFFVDHALSDEEIDQEVLSEAEVAAEAEVVVEMNYFTGSSIAFTQPAFS
ncbi:hypothetical protein PIB30_064391 [Stylosanthes scabra]|uniref:Uncharacterized protein n=1 Tax=Stylosanthes scabra TaxID=79078 RepID=A0ABU6SLN9_9FABA|nr:hypothetical protein [Stylosanthes scabra]